MNMGYAMNYMHVVTAYKHHTVNYTTTTQIIIIIINNIVFECCVCVDWIVTG